MISRSHGRLFRAGNLVKHGLPVLSNPTDVNRRLASRWSEGRRPTYAVVGAGSAGCVMANRLSEDPNVNVLLIEAGPPDDWWRWSIHMPGAVIKNLRREKYNWSFKAEAEPNLNNRIDTWPRGRVWGGSSSLNTMIYVRGHPYDYDRWVSEGATGWSFAEVLPYFKKAQTHSKGVNEYRGGSGPLYVSYPKYNNPLHEVWIQAGQQAGYPYNDDFNGFMQEGFGPFHHTIKNGRRWNTSQAYIWPVLKKRPNLWVLSEAHTNRILFDGQRAVGLEVEHAGSTKKIRVESDVILCAGAVCSPKILLQSGVGNGDALRKLDIPVVHHAPAVGQDLSDHMGTTMQVALKKPVSQCKQFTWKYPYNVGRHALQWFLTKTGQVASVQLETGAFVRSDESVQHPDLEYHFTPLALSYEDGRIMNKHAFQIHSQQLRPTSVGSIGIRSKNPRDPPVIKSNYLDTELDREICRRGIKIFRKLVGQKAFEPFVAHEMTPGADATSDEALDSFLRKNSSTCFHPCRTAKMGRADDKNAVVDPTSMKVWGLEGVRVVDTSVMPSIPSGNLNAPVIMIAEHSADLIQKKPKLQPEHVPIYRAHD